MEAALPDPVAEALAASVVLAGASHFCPGVSVSPVAAYPSWPIPVADPSMANFGDSTRKLSSALQEESMLGDLCSTPERRDPEQIKANESHEQKGSLHGNRRILKSFHSTFLSALYLLGPFPCDSSQK